MTTLWTIIAILAVLAPIILVHELGHFIAARLSGIRVDEFGLGFPPRAVTLFKRGDTIYTLNWLPLGGFVRPAGEDDPNVPGGLAGASKRARFFTLSAGALANFLLAGVILWVTFMVGTPIYDREKVAVGGVRADTPAQTAGLLEGDIILEAAGKPVDGYEALNSEVTRHQGQTMMLLVERDGQLLTLEITPRAEGSYNPDIEGPLGIAITYPPTGEWQRAGPIEAAGRSVESIYEFTSLTLRAPAMLISGELTPAQARPVSIIGIGQIAGQAAETTADTGDWSALLSIAAAISIALGLTNLLPLPALDGGRILFVLIEAVRGRRIEPEREGTVHLVGMLVLLGLMVVLMIQDIINPIIF